MVDLNKGATVELVKVLSDDLRTGADGEVYSSAGAAVRQQTEMLKSGNGVKYLNDINMLYSKKTDGKFLYYSNGIEADNSDWSYFDFIEVVPTNTYYSNIKSLWICYYDQEHNYISGQDRSNQYNFTVPPDTKYARISYNHSEPLRYGNTIPLVCIAYDYIPDIAVNTDKKRLNAELLPIAADDLSEFITHGKNLFNKHKARQGYFISWNTGYSVGENNDFVTCFDYVLCEPSTSYVCNIHSAIICEYDASKSFIVGHNLGGSSVFNFTTAANAKFLRIGVNVNYKDTFQLEKGTVSTAYEAFRYDFVTEWKPKKYTFSVGATGEYDFTTITDAVNNANDGDIIYITNGTYHEAVDCRNKFLNFVGESKDKVIWEYENGNYEYPPLEIAKGTVENLTFRAVAQERQPGTLGKAYSVHIDFNESIGQYLSFKNVKFVNEDYQTIGIGLRQDFTVEFTDCEFICKDNNNAFYCHDSVVQSTNQNVILRDCTFTTAGIAYCVHLQSQEVSGSEAFVTFQRCIVVNESANNLIKMTKFNESIGGGNYLESTDWHLTRQSFLNSASEMNYL